MMQSHNQDQTSDDDNLIYQLQFYDTKPYDCSYIKDQQARSQVATPSHLINHSAYSELIRHGFRRSGTLVYRPHCDLCHACIPARICVNLFQANRNQRRTLKRHADLEATTVKLELVEEHFSLYQKYQQKRHANGGMDQDNRGQYVQFLLQSNVDTRLVEFRDANYILRMVSMIDVLEDGLSSVYTFFDPDIASASFGTFNILWQIALAREMNLPFVYLGYWIAASRKMSYKTNFPPLQGLSNGKWQYI